MWKKVPVVPEAPADDYETVRQQNVAVRQRLAEIEAEITRIESERWAATGGDDLKARAEAYLADPSTRASSESKLEKLIAEREVVRRAAQIAGEKFAAAQEARTRKFVSSLRPAHRAAAEHVATCLVQLGRANAEERRIRLKAPGGRLPFLGFPGVYLDQQDCAAKHFLRYLKRAYGIEPTPAAF